MPAPSPDAFDQDCTALITEILRLRREFRWAHGIAYGRQVVDTAHVSTTPTDRDGDIIRAAAAHRDADPLHSEAFDHAGLRAQLVAANATIRKSMNGVSSSVDKLQEKMLQDERPHGMFDPVKNPRSLDPHGVEHEQLRAAQERRNERGEEVGTGRSPSARELDPTVFGSRRR